MRSEPNGRWGGRKSPYVGKDGGLGSGPSGGGKKGSLFDKTEKEIHNEKTDKAVKEWGAQRRSGQKAYNRGTAINPRSK